LGLAPQFTLNGAMFCRDEGLLPSFTERFKTKDPEQKIWLNWDMRIKSDTEGGNPFVAVTPDSSHSSVLKPKFEIHISDWRQVK